MIKLLTDIGYGAHCLSLLGLGLPYILWIGGLITTIRYGFDWPIEHQHMVVLWLIQTGLYLIGLFHDD